MKILQDNEILNNIKSIIGIKSDKEFAELLGVSQSTFANWRQRNSCDLKFILTHFDKYDFNLLLKGVSEQNNAELDYLKAELEKCRIIIESLTNTISEAKKHSDFKKCSL
jgi:hypothetical protein